MVAREDQPIDKDDRFDLRIQPLMYLCLLVAAVWFGSGVVIYFGYPDWVTRGTVGDTFGAVNALFSGLALAGVVYAIILQRKELYLQRLELKMNRRAMNAQLEEMRASRRTQSQPLCLPVVSGLRIERPRFDYAPADDLYSAVCRYHVAVGLRNPTEYPCIAINIRVDLAMQLSESTDVLSSANEYLECLAPTHVLRPGDGTPDFMFAGDETCRFFDALTQPNPGGVPIIAVVIYYKNITGAHFNVCQVFRVNLDRQAVAKVGGWHASVAGFDAKYAEQVNELRSLPSRTELEWAELFEKVKNSFDSTLECDDRELELAVESWPATFDVKQVQEKEYRTRLSESRYGQQVVFGSYEYPVDIHGVKQSL